MRTWKQAQGPGTLSKVMREHAPLLSHLGTPRSEGRPQAGAAVAAGIFFLALLVRVVYLIDSADYPAFSIPIFDARNYDDCARRWVSGAGMEAQFFWQPFFYPFFLACVYALNGGSILGVKVLQVVLGALTCTLTYWLGRRLFNPQTGIWAGVITAFYGPLIFHESELLAAGWAAFWSLVVLLLFLRIGARPNPWIGVVLGTAGALSILTRPEFLLFTAAAGLWLAGSLWWTAGRRRCLLSCGAVLAGFTLVVLPVAAQNARVTGHFSLLPYSGGVNVYLGNHPDPRAVATTVGFRWDELQRRPQRAGYTNGYDQQRWFYQQTWAYVSNDPAGFAKRLLWKMLQCISAREIPRSADVYTVRHWSVLQTLLTWKALGFGFPFGVLLPLALLGIASQRRRIPGPVGLFLLLYPLALVLVFVTARYRVPMVPILATLAAAGGITIVRAVRSRAWRRLALDGAACAAVVLLASVPGPFALERAELNTETGLHAGIGHYYRAQGDWRQALEYYEREIAVNPRSMTAHTEAGHLLRELGRHDEALAHYARAVRAHPDVATTHLNYGIQLRDAGRPTEAAEQLRTAVALEPDEEKHQFVLAAVLAQLRDFPGAAAVLRAALRLSPNDSGMRCLLGRVLEDVGQVEEAVAEYRTVLQLDPGHGEAQQRLRRVLERQPAP